MTEQLKFLQTERVYLRPLLDADADGNYVGWLNDAEVCRGNSHHVFSYTADAAREYIRFANQTKDNLILAIALQDGDRHIGNVALQSIHPINRSAEFTIVIGDKTVWGKGYGQDAARLVCAHGFSALNLHRIYCGTFADNIGMQKLAAYLGMKEEGRRREMVFKNGRYVDVIEYGVLRTEFDEQFPSQQL